MDREALLSRARTRGVRPLVYWCVRAVLQPFFHVWFRLSRIGREHIPASGAAILASNHRSFLDPFVIAVMTRRPIYFVAKQELFVFHPVVSWMLSALGAFPIDRGASDQEAMATAKAILERGDIVLMFPEGTRVRPGSLGRARRGVGRLALETGAPVVPVAIIGPEDVAPARRVSRLPCVDKEQLDREFSELYRAHLRDVYSYSYYRVGNHHDAEDLTEQTFLQAYRHFERAVDESEGRPLRPWLIRIAHNLAANLYRDRARRPQSPLEESAPVRTTHTTEGLVQDRDDLARILEGVRQLPDDRREALIMRFALGMDNREIARALGRTDGATKVLIHRAIRQLEEIVQADANGTE